MAPYYIVLIIIITSQFIFYKQNNKNNYVFIVCMLILFLFAGMRGNGAGDYFTYKKYAALITDIPALMNKNFPMEVGFRLISFVVNKLSLDIQFVITIMNAISLSCIYVFIKRYSPDKIFSLFLFLPMFMLFDMHAARTAVALSIGSLGLKYVLEKKIIPFVLIILLASCFHKIAIVLLLIYFLNMLKVSLFFYYGTILISYLLVMLLDINKIIVFILKIIGLNNLLSRFTVYMNDATFGYKFSLLDPRLLLSILIFIFSIFVVERLKNKNSEQENLDIIRLLIKINWLLIFLMIVFSNNTIFVIRIYGLYNIYSIIQIPIILKEYKKISNYESYLLTKIVIVTVYTLYLIVLINGYPEYKFYFNN